MIIAMKARYYGLSLDPRFKIKAGHIACSYHIAEAVKNPSLIKYQMGSILPNRVLLQKFRNRFDMW